MIEWIKKNDDKEETNEQWLNEWKKRRIRKKQMKSDSIKQMTNDKMKQMMNDKMKERNDEWERNKLIVIVWNK